MKIIKEFEKIGKVPYVKRIPKNEPTSSYYHPVRCITECMMRSDEQNRHVHGSYAEETDLSSNVNDTDEDKSKEIIVHKSVSENLFIDVSKSEYDFVFFDLALVLRARRLPTPFLVSPIFPLTLKMWFPSCSDCQFFLRHSR